MLTEREAKRAKDALMNSLDLLDEIQRVTIETDWTDEWGVQSQRAREIRDGLETIVTELVLSQVKTLVSFGRDLEQIMERKKLWERNETFGNSWMERGEELEVIEENTKRVLTMYLHNIQAEELWW